MRYLTSSSFLTLDIAPESTLLLNINKKLFKDLKFYSNNIFIEIDNLEFILIKKNEIVFYPYTVKFLVKQGAKSRIPIFLERPSILLLLLESRKIKYRIIKIDNIENELSETEKDYYYQERLQIDALLNKTLIFKS